MYCQLSLVGLEGFFLVLVCLQVYLFYFKDEEKGEEKEEKIEREMLK